MPHARKKRIRKHYCLKHLKALVFLYAFEESVDCHLLSSFCDDSNLHISLFKYVLSTMGVSKESISKFLTGNWFYVKLRILSPENCKQSLQVKSWKAEVTAENKQTQDYNQISKFDYNQISKQQRINKLKTTTKFRLDWVTALAVFRPTCAVCFKLCLLKCVLLLCT